MCAGGCGGVGTEDTGLGGEEGEFIECAAQRGLIGVTVDVAEELGSGECAAEHVGFEAGHVDAVGREAAERFVEGGRDVADAEDEGGHEAGNGGFGVHWRLGGNVEAGGVVGSVLDVGAEDVETVDFGGQGAGDGGVFGVLPLGDLKSSPGGVGFDDGLCAEFGDDVADLAEGDGVRVDAADLSGLGAGRGEQAVFDALEVFGDDVEAAAGEEGVHVGDAAGEGVFAREHGEGGGAGADGLDGVFE